MPIHKEGSGWEWGNHGHVYPSREGAERQAAAAHAHGYTGDAKVKGAGMLFVTPDGKGLFLKRSGWGDHKGEWALPGGTAEGDEKPLETARRESIEEIGDVPEGDCSLMSHLTSDEGVEFSTFLQRVENNFVPELNGEHDEYAWLPLDQPPEPLHPGVRRALDSVATDEQERDADGKFGSGGGEEESPMMKSIRESKEQVDKVKAAGTLKGAASTFGKSSGYGTPQPKDHAHYVGGVAQPGFKIPPKPAQDSIAFDRGSVRKYDQDGRLHIERTNISKANVCPYLGAEIANAKALGLDPKKTYMLYRDPEELKKGAATFNNIPILDEHVPVHAAAPQKQLVIGSTGTDAEFKGPYLTNSLVFWDQDAIDDIESEERVELSCAYHYTADMTPGVHAGTRYDGVMRDIRGNHVALVPEGRAGPDVIVGDSQLKPGANRMANQQQVLSRKAMLAKGALMFALPSMLAADAKPHMMKTLNQALQGVAADNWKKEGKAKIIAAFKGKFASDASPDMLAKMLDSLDNGEETMMDEEQAPVDQLDPDAALKEGEGKVNDEAVPETVDKDTPKEKAAQMGKDDDLPGMMGELSPEHCAIVKAVVQALKGGAAKDEPPPGVTPAAKTDGKDPNADKEGQAMSQGMGKDAVNKAIAAAVEASSRKIREDMRAVAAAEEYVRPIVGKLAVACDSADAVYKAALDAMGVAVEGIHPSAYRTMIEAHRTIQANSGRRPALQLASDSSSTGEFDKMFPEASRIRHI